MLQSWSVILTEVAVESVHDGYDGVEAGPVARVTLQALLQSQHGQLVVFNLEGRHRNLVPHCHFRVVYLDSLQQDQCFQCLLHNFIHVYTTTY